MCPHFLIALITQSRLRTQWVIGYAGNGGGECCVWHVNSNQGSDIHQVPRPTVRINLWREGGARKHFSLFLFPSVATFLTFTLLSSSQSSCFLPLIYLPLTLPSRPLSFPPLSGCLFSALTSPISTAFLFSHAVMSQHSYFVCGRWCEALSLMLTVGVSGIWVATVQQMDVPYEDFDRGFMGRTRTHEHVSDHSHMSRQHAVIHTHRHIDRQV